MHIIIFRAPTKLLCSEDDSESAFCGVVYEAGFYICNNHQVIWFPGTRLFCSESLFDQYFSNPIKEREKKNQPQPPTSKHFRNIRKYPRPNSVLTPTEWEFYCLTPLCFQIKPVYFDSNQLDSSHGRIWEQQSTKKLLTADCSKRRSPWQRHYLTKWWMCIFICSVTSMSGLSYFLKLLVKPRVCGFVLGLFLPKPAGSIYLIYI